jgi:hypothetical protein
MYYGTNEAEHAFYLLRLSTLLDRALDQEGTRALILGLVQPLA